MPVSDVNCNWVLDRIEPFVDGELATDELESIEAHSASCRSCREEIALARSLVTELRSLPALECPSSVVDEAAARAEAGRRTGARPGTFKERLRGWYGSLSVPVPKPAMAVMIVIIVAATAFVLSQHEQSALNGRVEVADGTPTEQEVELARIDVMLAFAYIGKYSRRSGEIIKQDVIGDRVMKPVGKTVTRSIYPFPGISKEKAQ
jgi:anti-sigma factor RsiW